ncbi:MAG: fimbrillin family protein [Muribaculaceae bacterium]
MKKSIFLAVAAVAMTACSNDVDLGMKDANKQTADNAIGFQVHNKNMSRANLEDAKHYNFGVWAYKDYDHSHDIMANYLVGYFGTNVGYNHEATTNDTYGSSSSNTDQISLWGYMGLGTSQYNWATNSGSQKFYTNSQTDYMSNWTEQFLRYWDLSSANTEFFAYAPYIHGSLTPTFTIADKKLSFPDGSIKDGYNDESIYEYLCAYTNVAKANYGNDVALNFEHLNARVRIVFYEDIQGYDVKLIKLHTNAGIIAVPATKDASDNYSYATGKLAKTAKAEVTLGPTINFAVPAATTFYVQPSPASIDADIKNAALAFRIPTTTKLSEDRATAVGTGEISEYYSPDTYYAIPNTGACGLTFRVSFQLTSTTNEVINVYDAGVFVPATNCKWDAGKNYTYVFKITKNTNGSTDRGENDPKVDPNPGDKALFPIVFDGITVTDWDIPGVESDHNIN